MNRSCARVGAWFRACVVPATVWLAAPAAAGSPAWTVEYLGAGQGASAMNESAQVVGSTTVAPGIRGWVASAATGLALLPLPPGMVSSWAKDINDAGVIVGAVGPSYTPEFGGQATAWVPDGAGGYTIVVLGTLPGDVLSDATALNNLGDIVGFSSDGTYRYPVLFSLDAAPQDLRWTGIFDPRDVNDHRFVVDASFTVKRLDLDTMEVVDLGVPPGPPSYLATSAAAINESNQVAGLAITASNPNCDRYAACYTEGAGWEILSQCGYANGGQDLNDRGDVVMRLNLAPHVRLEGLGTFPIEDLIVNDVGHWYLVNSFGLAINNARQMVVWGHNPGTGQDGILLLTPVTVPGDLNGDGCVDQADLGQLLASFDADGGGDLDGDGDTDQADLGVLLSAYGDGC